MPAPGAARSHLAKLVAANTQRQQMRLLLVVVEGLDSGSAFGMSAAAHGLQALAVPVGGHAAAAPQGRQSLDECGGG